LVNSFEYPQLSKPIATVARNQKTPSSAWCPKTPSGDPMEKKNLGRTQA